MDQKNLILHLIKDDLVNTKLIRGFNHLGIDAEDYHIRASEVVFKLMGFDDSPRTELIREQYHELSKATEYIEVVADRKLFQNLALEIYNYLNAVSKNPINESKEK